MSKNDPLDGSVSGTIGGGGAEAGGPTERPTPADAPPARPEDAASGRLAPDPLAAATSPEPTPVRVEVEKRDREDGQSDR